MSVDVQGFGKEINELLVLTVLAEGAKHGYQIALDVEAESGGVFGIQHGTLYPILHRLEGRGLIEGRWTRRGRRRKEYELTRAGRRHLGEEAGRVRSVFERLVGMLGGVGGEPIQRRPQEG